MYKLGNDILVGTLIGDFRAICSVRHQRCRSPMEHEITERIRLIRPKVEISIGLIKQNWEFVLC